MRMSFFSKLLVTIAGCLTTMMLLTNVAMYRAFFHNPNQITTRYEQITFFRHPGFDGSSIHCLFKRY